MKFLSSYHAVLCFLLIFYDFASKLFIIYHFLKLLVCPRLWFSAVNRAIRRWRQFSFIIDEFYINQTKHFFERLFV